MKRKVSVRKQVIAITIAIVAGTVLLCLFLNSVFLVSFYMMKKQTQLANTFEEINDASKKEILYSDRFDVNFETIASNGNLDIEVITSDGVIMRSSSSSAENLKDQLFRSIFAFDEESQAIMDQTEYYTIARTKDDRLGGEYIVLWGNVDDGNIIFIRSSIGAIEDSSAISSRFLLYTGFISVLVAAIASAIIGRSITAPVLYMMKLSKRMAELDFEAKYVNNKSSVNEMDMLGEHMNEMSEKLEASISELKSANLELTKDIEKKTEIDEMRKDFISNVSHELKTPIALIEGYAEGLKEFGDEDKETRDYYCDVIMDEAVKMNRMVRRLLNLNQLEFGGNIAEIKRFNITEFVKNILSSSALLAENKGATVTFNEEKNYFVWGDEFMIEEVFTNYFSNAVNHVSGEMKIEISFEDKGDILRVSVFNTGEQIPEEDIDNIWVKFYKVDKARTREYGGNGIGLSIVKAIMEAHKKECGVENCSDGVRFWFELDKNV